METCNCNAGLNNTGNSNCPNIQDVAYHLILMAYQANDGTINSISTSDFVAGELPASFVTGKLNESDASKRWFPIREVRNVEDVRGDSTFETLNDGTNLFVQQGVRQFTAIIVKSSAQYLKKIENVRCVNVAAFIVDKSGNLIGDDSVAGELRPILIDNETWDPRMVWATDTTVQKVNLTFSWDITVQDSDVNMIKSSQMLYKMLDVRGLLDVDGQNVANVSTTGFDIELISDFGAFNDPEKVTGLTVADMELYNETTLSTVALTTFDEDPANPGSYTATFPAQTSLNELQLRITADGYDDANLVLVDISIP